MERRSIRGWMPADLRPGASGADQERTVEAQRLHRRPSCRGQAHNLVARRRPAKVLTPDLPPWIKQRRPGLGQRVASCDPITLVQIALAARQPEVRLFSGP